MASHRIQVTLTQDTFDQLRALSDASGASMSSIVAEHLDAVAPVLGRTAQLLTLGKQAQEERRQRLHSIVQDADRAITPLVVRAVSTLGETFDRMDQVVAPADQPTAAKRSRRAARRA